MNCLLIGCIGIAFVVMGSLLVSQGAIAGLAFSFLGGWMLGGIIYKAAKYEGSQK